VEGLISSDPCIIALSPHKSDDATGPSSAMVVWCEWDIVSVQKCVLVVSQYNRPSAKEHLTPTDTGLTGD
jgi:hypothetical protein